MTKTLISDPLKVPNQNPNEDLDITLRMNLIFHERRASKFLFWINLSSSFSLFSSSASAAAILASVPYANYVAATVAAIIALVNTISLTYSWQTSFSESMGFKRDYISLIARLASAKTEGDIEAINQDFHRICAAEPPEKTALLQKAEADAKSALNKD